MDWASAAPRWLAGRFWQGLIPLAAYQIGRGADLVATRLWLRHADPACFAYKPDAGPHAVTVSDLALRDDDRDRSVPVRVYAPIGGFERRPVIIMSHGLACSGHEYPVASRYWASHGYVCVHPTHEESNSLWTEEQRKVRFPQGVRRYVTRNPRAWGDRCRDISLVIDRLSEIESRLGDGVRLDAARVGVAGHSYGADIVQLIAGVRIVPAPGEVMRFADRRAKAALMLAGQGREPMYPTPDCWSEVTIPMMTMAGSDDWFGRRRGPAWREEPFRFSPPGGKYHVLIERANHLTFTLNESDQDSSRARRKVLSRRAYVPDPRPAFAVIKSASLAFWDAHLNEDAAAQSYLRSDRLRRSSRGAARLKWK